VCCVGRESLMLESIVCYARVVGILVVKKDKLCNEVLNSFSEFV